jgi:hypothetical protein
MDVSDQVDAFWRQKPPVEQEAEVNPEPVRTQKRYRSSNPVSPAILVTIPIYHSKRELRSEGRFCKLLWPNVREEKGVMSCLTSHS